MILIRKYITYSWIIKFMFFYFVTIDDYDNHILKFLKSFCYTFHLLIKAIKLISKFIQNYRFPNF